MKKYEIKRMLEKNRIQNSQKFRRGEITYDEWKLRDKDATRAMYLNNNLTKQNEKKEK